MLGHTELADGRLLRERRNSFGVLGCRPALGQQLTLETLDSVEVGLGAVDREQLFDHPGLRCGARRERFSQLGRLGDQGVVVVDDVIDEP